MSALDISLSTIPRLERNLPRLGSGRAQGRAHGVRCVATILEMRAAMGISRRATTEVRPAGEEMAEGASGTGARRRSFLRILGGMLGAMAVAPLLSPLRAL